MYRSKGRYHRRRAAKRVRGLHMCTRARVARPIRLTNASAGWTVALENRIEITMGGRHYHAKYFSL